jgi:hypothetical protein
MRRVTYVPLEKPVPQHLPTIDCAWSLPDETDTVHLFLYTRTGGQEIVLSRVQHPELYDLLLEETGPLDATSAPPFLRPGSKRDH